MHSMRHLRNRGPREAQGWSIREQLDVQYLSLGDYETSALQGEE